MERKDKIGIWIMCSLMIIIFAFSNKEKVKNQINKALKVTESWTSSKAESKTLQQQCEQWKSTYGSLSYNDFEKFEINDGETWLLELNESKWSGTLHLNTRISTVPAGKVEILTVKDSMRYVDKPKLVLNGVEKLKFRGCNCVLIKTK